MISSLVTNDRFHNLRLEARLFNMKSKDQITAHGRSITFSGSQFSNN